MSPNKKTAPPMPAATGDTAERLTSTHIYSSTTFRELQERFSNKPAKEQGGRYL